MAAPARRTLPLHMMIGSIIETSDDDITMSAEVWAAFDKLHSFMFDRLYFNPIAKNEEKKVDAFISRMFAYFIDTPDKLPPEFRAVYEREGAARAACDYIAGMTDTFAVQMYNELFIPQGWPMVSGIGGM